MTASRFRPDEEPPLLELRQIAQLAGVLCVTTDRYENALSSSQSQPCERVTAKSSEELSGDDSTFLGSPSESAPTPISSQFHIRQLDLESPSSPSSSHTPSPPIDTLFTPPPAPIPIPQGLSSLIVDAEPCYSSANPRALYHMFPDVCHDLLLLLLCTVTGRSVARGF